MTFKKMFLFSLVLILTSACFKKEDTTTKATTTNEIVSYPEVSVKCGDEACVK